MPLVDRRVELHAGITAHVCAFGDRAHQVARLVRIHDFGRVGDSMRFPRAVVEHGPHEVVGDADAVVRVLEKH